MAESSKAIFLSYAREDAGAARRIADALRSAGLEVWFDESELRGGDAWDAKIRRQIDECSLFVPIISSHTQERSKGYFRLEWKLAVDQTHLLAAGVPFVAPVVIDTTKESEAIVPPEFMKVQWTRLPEALPTPQFVGQIKALLASPTGMVAGGQPPALKATASQGGSRTVGAPRRSWLVPVIAGVVIAAGLAFFMLRKPAPAPAPTVVAAPAAVETKPAALTTDKSIAVLPFTNMSDDKDSGFFTDGIHEDILTNIALIRELRVVSRTSVLPYRASGKSMRQIAQELGVTYILEGSVRRAGNKVRVTGQLIHAATDEHVWAQAYDRDLTDIFAIQTELSQQIAGALKAALSPQEKILIARRPTENPAAYDLYLRARDVFNREDITLAAKARRIALLQSAVDLDPTFAYAWGELADACAFSYFGNDPGMDALLARAKVAMDRALQLAPDDPEIISCLGTYYYYGYRDYARATEQYEKLARLQPNSPVVFNSLGLIQRRQGRWAESLPNTRRATELDPANVSYLRNLLATLRAARRWDEAIATQRRIAALRPEDIWEAYDAAKIFFVARGSKREVEAFFSQLSPEQKKSPVVLELQKDWARLLGDWAEAIRLDRLQPYYDEDGDPHWMQAYFAAYDLFAKGDRAGAISRLGDFPASLRAKLESEPANALDWSYLAGMEIMLGHTEEALRCMQRGEEILPEARDALDGVGLAKTRARLYDMAGEKERALAEYTRLMNVPSPFFLNVHSLKAGYSTLHGDPRFEALLADPKNNAPRF